MALQLVKQTNKELTAQELADISGFPVFTIMYYKKEGLLLSPDGKYSEYDIHTLEAIRDIINIYDNPNINTIKTFLYLLREILSEEDFTNELEAIARDLQIKC